MEWNESLATGTRGTPCGAVGVVVGATDLCALRRVRQKAGDVWILCPGVGSQGGDLQVSRSQGHDVSGVTSQTGSMRSRVATI